MQTFLVSSSFEESARCLDYKRLGKQRVESFQLWEILMGLSKGWEFHPALKMWRGYEAALLAYYTAICNEWIKRGYKQIKLPRLNPSTDYDLPWWLGDDRLHSSHRAALLDKNFEYYNQFNWEETPKYEYWWPTKGD